MNFEEIQSIKSEVKANIDQLQRFATLLPMLKVVREKATKQFSLLQGIMHKQVLQRISAIEQQIEPHLLLLVNSEKLLHDAMDAHQASCIGEDMTDEAIEASLQELNELTKTIEEVRILLFYAIDSATNWQRYDLQYKYPQYEPVLNRKREALNAGLDFGNTSLYSYDVKRYRQDTTQLADDIDLTCDEDLDDDNPVFTLKK
ncbi:MAG: hypothetical protein WC748_05600 [Legionellales bacterium]|jgi:hypothetical protein